MSEPVGWGYHDQPSHDWANRDVPPRAHPIRPGPLLLGLNPPHPGEGHRPVHRLRPGPRTSHRRRIPAPAGHARNRKFSRFHAVFSRDRWSALELGRRLLLRLARTSAPQGGSTLAIDETLERRRGAEIAQRGFHRDPIASGKGQHVAASGLRWMVLALVVDVPRDRHRWALPFLSRPAPLGQGRCRPPAAAQSVWAPNRRGQVR